MDSITIPATESTPNADADKALLERAAKDSLNPGTDTTPKTYGGKYNSVEDLEKGYAELVKKLGSQGKLPTETPPVTPPTDKPAADTPPDLSIDAAKDAVTAAGLDFAKYNSSFAKDGKLSDAEYTELESKGFSRETVDVYVEGLKSRQTTFANTAYEIAGSKEQYGSMVEWAKANLKPSEIEVFNTALGKGVDSMKLAVTGLKASWHKATGKEPNLVQGNLTPAVGAGYANMRELSKDQSDPRYKTDPAFRRSVEEKLARSTF